MNNYLVRMIAIVGICVVTAVLTGYSLSHVSVHLLENTSPSLRPDSNSTPPLLRQDRVRRRGKEPTVRRSLRIKQASLQGGQKPSKDSKYVQKTI